MSLLDVQLHRVETADDAAAFMRWLSERHAVVAIDTETTGLKYWTPHFTRLIQFGDTQQGWTIGQEWHGLARQALRSYDGEIVFHNAKFDLHALQAADMPVPQRHQLHDTYVQHCLIDPLGFHGLKSLAEKHVDPSAGMGAAMLNRAKKEGGWDWATIPESVPAYGLYAAIDTVLTARLHEKFYPQVQAKYLTAYEREMSAQHILFRAETRGIRIDSARTTALREQWTVELAGLRTQLGAMGIANPNANRQIEDALLAAGWEPSDFTATGQAKLDKATFKSILASSGLDVASEVVKVLVEYKQKLKWKSSYLDAFLADQDEFGFVHPDIRTLQARTGRMSITRPALQTLPKDPSIRGCIIPASDDETIYAIDYDSQEARIFIHYSGEEQLADVIARGEDLHCYIASEVYGAPIDKSDPRRGTSKNTLYALMYGAGVKRIAFTSGISIDEAQTFVDTMYHKFPGIKQFMAESEVNGKMALGTKGRAEVRTWGGRDVVADPDKIYTLVNYLVQGSAADVLKEKLVQLDSAGLADHIIVPVHDELLFSLPQGEEGAEIALKCKTIMEETSFHPSLTCALSGPFADWGSHYSAD